MVVRLCHQRVKAQNGAQNAMMTRKETTAWRKAL